MQTRGGPSKTHGGGEAKCLNSLLNPGPGLGLRGLSEFPKILPRDGPPVCVRFPTWESDRMLIVLTEMGILGSSRKEYKIIA